MTQNSQRQTNILPYDRRYPQVEKVGNIKTTPRSDARRGESMKRFIGDENTDV